MAEAGRVEPAAPRCGPLIMPEIFKPSVQEAHRLREKRGSGVSQPTASAARAVLHGMSLLGSSAGTGRQTNWAPAPRAVRHPPRARPTTAPPPAPRVAAETRSRAQEPG